jgi:hypothetical protein
MKDSPFIYGTTVSRQGFTNREQETRKLIVNLTGGINTMIISPRRWGKSSLVEKVIGDIKATEKNKSVVLIDLFTVKTEEEFLEVFAREIIKVSSSKWEDWMNSGKSFFKALIPKFSIGVDPGNDFSLSFDWKELKKHADEVLNLPETICQKKGIKMIICLDEFQDLANFPDYTAFEKKMRSVWQRQKSVTYCLFGSKRHMMLEIFNNSSKPFYRFGDIMLLEKIKTEKWVAFIRKCFADTGKQIGEKEAALIPYYMKNHSWYVQQLSHYTWNLTAKKVTVENIKTALDEVINANSPLYQKEIESISLTQLNFLKAIVKGETKLTSVAIMEKYQLGTPRNVAKNRIALVNGDLIYETKGVYELADPVFERWFKRAFFKELV